MKVKCSGDLQQLLSVALVLMCSWLTDWEEGQKKGAQLRNHVWQKSLNLNMGLEPSRLRRSWLECQRWHPSQLLPAGGPQCYPCKTAVDDPHCFERTSTNLQPQAGRPHSMAHRCQSRPSSTPPTNWMKPWKNIISSSENNLSKMVCWKNFQINLNRTAVRNLEVFPCAQQKHSSPAGLTAWFCIDKLKGNKFRSNGVTKYQWGFVNFLKPQISLKPSFKRNSTGQVVTFDHYRILEANAANPQFARDSDAQVIERRRFLHSYNEKRSF